MPATSETDTSAIPTPQSDTTPTPEAPAPRNPEPGDLAERTLRAMAHSVRRSETAGLPSRRPCATETVDDFAVTVSFDPPGGPLAILRGELVACETFISKRAKSGSELEEHQYALGVAASKLMQGEGLA